MLDWIAIMLDSIVIMLGWIELQMTKLYWTENNKVRSNYVGLNGIEL